MKGSSPFERIRGERCPHCHAAPGDPCIASAEGSRVIQLRSHHRARILAERQRAEAARRAADALYRP